VLGIRGVEQPLRCVGIGGDGAGWGLKSQPFSPKSPMSKARSSPAESQAPQLPDTYEAALAELEQLVARLDAGQLPLDQLLVQYQRGAQLLGFCRDRLKNVEEQIKVMDNGELKPWVSN